VSIMWKYTRGKKARKKMEGKKTYSDSETTAPNF